MSRVALLTDLQSYAKSTEVGQSELKESLWQLTKLRRKQCRGLMTMEDHFSADQIREELRARSRVLMDEKDTSDVPQWTLVDVLEAKAVSSDSTPVPTLADEPDGTTGMRQRKGASVAKSTTTTTTTTTTDSTSMTQVLDTKEEELLSKSMLEIFSGVRPGDLITAQKHAKKALESYIQAANQAARILQQTNSP